MRRPLPFVDDVNRFFWEGAARRKLLFQCCTTCGGMRHPPALACMACGSFDWDVVESSGRGTIFSYSIPRRPELALLDEGMVLVVVELEEGVRVVSNLVGVGDASAVDFGAPVESDFLPLSDNLALPIFRLVSAGEDKA